MASNYGIGLFNQLQEMIKKCDSLLSEIKQVKDELRATQEDNKIKDAKIMELTEKLSRALDKIDELQEKLDNEKSKNNKNSSNSSKPSSTDIAPPKKNNERINKFNLRSSNSSKKGGQFGHIGHNLSKKDIEKKIKERKLKVIETVHYIKGDSKNEPLIKYRVALEIKTVIHKHTFIYSENATDSLPKEFQTDVTYDNSIKSLAINLDTVNVVSLDRQTDFFNAITDGFLTISKGTLMNFKEEFSLKSQPSLQNIVKHLKNKTRIWTDETNSKKNGKKIYARNYSNKESVIYKMNEHKGHTPIKEDGILTDYIGGIMADHDTTIDSYGTERYECNIHVGRYLTEIEQLVPDVSWAFKIKNLLFIANNTRKIAMSYGLKKFSKEKIKEYSDKYDEILIIAEQENKHILSKTFRGKAENLRKRLLRDKEKHIAFIRDFSIDFDNNLSERDLRVFKSKTKISGGFRSKSGAQYFADALSIVRTAKKRQMNPMDAIVAIFNNQVLFE